MSGELLLVGSVPLDTPQEVFPAALAYLGLDPRALEFSRGEHGKPMLATPGTGPLQFNLSHSGDLALYAVSDAGAVGIDVEVRRRRVVRLHHVEHEALRPGVTVEAGSDQAEVVVPCVAAVGGGVHGQNGERPGLHPPSQLIHNLLSQRIAPPSRPIGASTVSR